MILKYVWRSLIGPHNNPDSEARKLSRAINVYKYMRRSKDSSCKPSVRTYNILFAALLGRGSNTYINYMYMDTISCLFKQMVNDGIEPDIFSLNFMIKGYAQSLHVNDALRVFHQMGVVYNCLPNSHTYNYLIHGLCVQGRTVNAKELYEEMKNKGFVPSSKAYNSLVNCFAINGEIEEAEKILWEVAEKRVVIDFITYQTVLNEICRQGMIGKAMLLLNELQEKDLVDGHAYRKLLCGVEDEFRISNCRN
ncbi:PREDICTED: pentatricopeptide repeat-containing protein At2g27800, mitochondrial-like isoform X2 [Nelumbo nucifera]|uniref:Pentatricopeptide repeat-containing protein At2g27800, mitochondrial-like isoform X2 n=1 Tax=Nelumbo nucifera TaxID=4432 RepID=A0A1U8B7M2_NELNU|nr:PREDICTED: pentatricopeptide repeat-containing protein At2g27800, mitochondrial-like isoform X2 [Nelumbo nucifera]